MLRWATVWTIDMGRKGGGAAVPLSVGKLGPNLTVSPEPRPTSIPSDILIYPTVGHNTPTLYRQDRQTTVP